MDTVSHNNKALDDRLHPGEDVMARMKEEMVSQFQTLTEKVETLTKEYNAILTQNIQLKMDNMRLENENKELKSRREGELHSGQYCTRPPADGAQQPALSAREYQLEAENEQLRRENQELKARVSDPLECGNEVDMEKALTGKLENKPILSFIWRLMQQDGARVKSRGDVKIINQILEAITGLPYNSCKKVWEVGIRPFTRKIEDISRFNNLLKSIGMKIQL